VLESVEWSKEQVATIHTQKKKRPLLDNTPREKQKGHVAYVFLGLLGRTHTVVQMFSIGFIDK
jgi:hypothetical protein